MIQEKQIFQDEISMNFLPQPWGAVDLQAVIHFSSCFWHQTKISGVDVVTPSAMAQLPLPGGGVG